MLFLGTEKYPSEDEYEGFLSKFGGSCNAYTDMEDTNYYLSITTQHSDPDTTSEGLSIIRELPTNEPGTTGGL